jgi:hypothetical protein
MKSDTIKRRGVLVPAHQLNFSEKVIKNLLLLLNPFGKRTRLVDYMPAIDVVADFNRLLPVFKSLTAITTNRFCVKYHSSHLFSNAVKVRPEVVSFLTSYFNYLIPFILVVSTHNTGIFQVQKVIKKLVKSFFLGLRLNTIFAEPKTARQFVFLGGLT